MRLPLPHMPDAHRLAVAPMMDWTDRHCRVFHRMLAPHAMLYTEMITADAIIHGDRDYLLANHNAHHSADDAVVLQIGGSAPEKLARAVRIAHSYGYAEYNLNVGCPSGRVQSGRFGACLMAEPERVKDCVTAMLESASGRHVTVKCRIGIDDMDTETGLDHFIDTVAEGGVSHFIIHARKALLNGLSPKDNRTIPPLDYDRVSRLQQRRPDLAFSINGGIDTLDRACRFAQEFRGVMIGRAAYQNPYLLAKISAELYRHDCPDRFSVAAQMADYADQWLAKGGKMISITRHMLGLMNGLNGAKAWRRDLSELARLQQANSNIIRTASERLQATIQNDTIAA